MDWVSALLLALAFALLVAGAWLLAPAAGVLTAGALFAVAGVLSLNASGKPKRGKATQ